ncbi:MAG: hypothetical protein FWC71_05640 [Defluviitaleaceae bacterium]|nr:hypothetical protein [Defluviitaleaceae bacterium]
MKEKLQNTLPMFLLVVLFLFVACGNNAGDNDMDGYGDDGNDNAMQTDAPTPYQAAPYTPAPQNTTPPTPTPTTPALLRAAPFATPSSGIYPPMHGAAIHVVEGQDVSFAILYDHSLWAWGVNDFGQLGYGPGAWWSPYPVRVMENVVYVAVPGGWGSPRRVYALSTDGGLYAWGNLTTSDVAVDVQTGAGIHFTPERIMDNITHISAGVMHTLAITTAGDLYEWGRGRFNGLPVFVMPNVVSAAAGNGQSLAVTADGAVYVWGDTGFTTFTCPITQRNGLVDAPLRVPGIENATAVVTGDTYGAQTLVRTADGRVWMWGGQTHHGIPNTDTPTLMPIDGFVIDINARHWRSYALTDDGNLWEWATIEGHRGFWLAAVPMDFMPAFIERYGHPETVEDNAAVTAFRNEFLQARADAALIPSITATGVTSIAQAVGSLFIAENGDVWHRSGEWVVIEEPNYDWHTDDWIPHYTNITRSDPDRPTPQPNPWFRPWVRHDSQPGPFTPRPPITNLEVPNPILLPVTAVAVGSDTSFAITEDHRLWTWGSMLIFPQDNAFAQRRNPDPRPIMYNVQAVEIGDNIQLALTLDGTLVQIRRTAHPILTDVTAIAAGFDHALALTADGTLYTWGENQYGQLGDGTFEANDTPIPIMENITAIAAGGNQSLAIRECGGLYIWGAHGIQAVRDEWENWGYTLTRLPRATPYRFMENIQSAAAGTWHTLAITTQGDLYAWGDNWHGATGAETFIFHDTPLRIMQNVRHVTAAGPRWGNGGHTLAITHDGELWAWGSGFLLGDGSWPVFRLPPTRIMENIAAVATDRHIMVATLEGHLYAWAESNYWGVLAGLGPVSPEAQIPFSSFVPVRITGTFER